MKLVLETDKPLARVRTKTLELRQQVAQTPPGGSYGGLTKGEALKVANAMLVAFGPRNSITLAEADGTYRVGRKALKSGSTGQEALLDSEQKTVGKSQYD